MERRVGEPGTAPAAPAAVLASMTGVGLARGNTELGDLSFELRSVNGRALAVKMRLPSALSGLEGALEAKVRARPRRGQVTVIGELGAAGGAEGVADVERAERAAAALRELARRLELEPPALADVLAVPGVLQGMAPREPRVSWELPEGVARLLDAALARLDEQRRAEGQAIAIALDALLAELSGAHASAAARAPAVIDGFRLRLLQRVNEFLAGHARPLADADVIREVALFADRADISEELQRLGAHLEQMRALLAAGGEVGRRLEFMAQELLREANTLGSKSPDVEMARLVVAMKAAIEKIKEQAANLE